MAIDLVVHRIGIRLGKLSVRADARKNRYEWGRCLVGERVHAQEDHGDEIGGSTEAPCGGLDWSALSKPRPSGLVPDRQKASIQISSGDD